MIKSIHTLIDWSKIEKIINRYYHKGETLQGQRPYSDVLLFKMLLLGIWNNLSDVRTESYVNDSLSAMCFCGLNLEDPVPDHSILSRFRNDFTRNRGMDKLLLAFNKQPEKHQVIVHTGLKPLLGKIPKRHKKQSIYVDKGYKVPANDELLKKQNMKNRLMHKAYRNRPLTHWQRLFNKLISKTRWVVERTFGSIKEWFGGDKARYMGLNKIHTQHILQATSYNLKRVPGINCIQFVQIEKIKDQKDPNKDSFRKFLSSFYEKERISSQKISTKSEKENFNCFEKLSNILVMFGLN